MLCHALVEAGALACEEDRFRVSDFRVSDDYAPLPAGVEDHSAIVGLRGAAAPERLLENLVVPGSELAYTDFSDADREAGFVDVNCSTTTIRARRP